MSGGSGPIVRVQIPSSPFVKGRGSLPRLSIVCMAPGFSSTRWASGASNLKVTVQSSCTSGELSGALKGTRPSASRWGSKSRLTLACWAFTIIPSSKMAIDKKHFFIFQRIYPFLVMLSNNLMEKSRNVLLHICQTLLPGKEVKTTKVRQQMTEIPE